MAYNNINDNYAGIIQALGQVRADAGEKQKYFPPNYQGIIDAILDMTKAWSGATPGDYPPGWNPIYDDDGNVIGGNWAPGYEPAQGNLWFDERQGRLMVYVDDAYYQTNGADVLTRVQNTQPQPDVPGALWYNPDTDDLYLFDGSIWILVSSQTVNTTTLPLVNPTDGASAGARVLPDSSGLSTQADLNQWVVSALQGLDQNLGGNADVYVSDSAPSDPEEGDLWYRTSTLELLIRYDGFWVPSSVSLVSDPNLTALATTVDTLNTNLTAQIQNQGNRLITLENEPHKSYDLKIDNATFGIELVDELGVSSSVPLAATGGLSVSNSNGVITYDASTLESQLSNVVNTYTNAQQRSALEASDTEQLNRIAALETAPKVSVTEFAGLSSTVSGLPTQAELAGKLSLSGGELTGQLLMNNNRIGGLGAALHPNDAVRNSEFQTYKSQVASTYAPISNPIFSGLVVERDDISVPGIKITGGAAGGRCAIELNTNRQTGTTAVFGQTQFPDEVAWEFNNTENFSWIHGTTGKQLRIDKDEVVIRNLSFGSFTKDQSGNDVITNKIDVKGRITAYQSALENIRSALNNSTSFEEFKTAALIALAGI